MENTTMTQRGALGGRLRSGGPAFGVPVSGASARGGCSPVARVVSPIPTDHSTGVSVRRQRHRR